MTVEDLQDVTKYAGVNIQEEADRILPGTKGQERPVHYAPEEQDKIFKLNMGNMRSVVERAGKPHPSQKFKKK